MPARRLWFGATLVGVAVGISGIPAGAQSPLPTVTVPSVTAPSVTVPSVTVPQVTVPPVTTPPVKTPTVTTPPVKTPTVTTPPVKTPTVTTPPVKTPTVATPKVATPSTSSATPSSSGSTTSSPSSSSSSPGSGSAGSGTGAGPTAGSGAATTPATSPGASTRAALPTVAGPPKTRKRDRALRDAVLRYEGCLDSVPRSERRVLSLRAGVGAAQTRTRAQVARITGLSPKRVARLERRGLKRLRGLGHAGRCSAAASTQSAGASQTVPALPEGSPTGVLGERETPQQHSASSKAKKPTARQVAVDHPLIDLGGAPVDFAPLVIALGLGALLLAVLRETRRERR